MRSRRLALAATFFIATIVPFQSAPLGAQSTFSDIDGNVHETNIIAIADAGITAGCDTAGTQYCPGDSVSRGQMASFLARALTLPIPGDDIVGVIADGTDGFAYIDDPFSTSEPAYADGARVDDGLQVVLGGVDDSDVFGISGGWTRSLVLEGAATVDLLVRYILSQTADYESSETSDVVIHVDGAAVGTTSAIASIAGGDDDDVAATTGWETFNASVDLSAGQHTITVGAYNAAKTTASEITTLQVSDIALTVAGERGRFGDVSGTHAANVDAVAAAGITLGCDAAGTIFCPNDLVTRAQMASFLDRALGLPDGAVTFLDVSGSVHAEAIGAIAAAGITAGCSTDGTRYCPSDFVRRDQMASFLARALGLDGDAPPPGPDPEPEPDSSGVPVASPTSIDFGARDIGAGATDVGTIDLRNDGGADITVDSISVSGTHAPDFVVVSDTGESTLAPGAARTVGVTFNPSSTSPSNRQATLEFSTSEGIVDVALSGTATDPVGGNSAPTVTNPGTQSDDVDDSVSLQIVANDADGDPLEFDASGLPSGLDISDDGLITGTVTSSGTWNPTVTAFDGIDEGSATFTWQVNSTEPPPSGFDLSMDRFYLSQAVPAADSDQSSSAQVDVVAGRDGLARAFVSASESNDAAPTVTLFWQSGSSSGSIVLSGPGSVPTSPSEATLGDTFTSVIDGSIIDDGVEVYVEVDPDDVIDEADESNNRYPDSGWLDLDAVVVPTLEITLVPITYLGVTPDLSDPDSWLDDTLRIMPVAGYDVIVRSSPLVVSDSSFNWSATLDDIYTLRTTDGSDRVYHGIVDPQYSSGIAGIGYIGAPAAISWANPGADGVVAHELGHNFNLDHAPCGVSGDASFPYSDGGTGVWGYDVIGGSLKNPDDYFDLMSYCGPEWISDYHFQKALDFRMSSSGFAIESAADEETLVVSGSMDPSTGAVTLDPLFTVDARVVLPQFGPYVLTGFDAAGAVLFSSAFDINDVEVLQVRDDGSRAPGDAALPSGFSFGVAVDADTIERLHRVEVSLAGAVLGQRSAVDVGALVSDGGGVRWKASEGARAVVIDSATGLVVQFNTSGWVEADPGHEVIVSDGLRSAASLVAGG